MEGELQDLKAEIAEKEKQLQEMTFLYLHHQVQRDHQKLLQENSNYAHAFGITSDYTASINAVHHLMEQLGNELNRAKQIRKNYVDERNSILSEFPFMSENIKTLDEFVIRSDKAYRTLKQFKFPELMPMLRPGELPWWYNKQNKDLRRVQPYIKNKIIQRPTQSGLPM